MNVFMQKKLLKISEFAALSGISRKLLIFYDNNGILHPQYADPENGYRYYAHRQLDTASVIVSLREAGMSLCSIREYLAGKSPEKLLALFVEREETLGRQIRSLALTREMIRERMVQTNKGICAKAGTVRVERQPAENLFLGEPLPDDYDLGDGWSYLPEFYAACRARDIPFGFTVGTMVLRENVRQYRWKERSCYFCRLPDGEYPAFFQKPAGRYAIGTDYADYGQVEALYQIILRFIEENRLEICGNAYEEYLIDEIAEENPQRYLLQIAVQVKARPEENTGG